jgi:hypothetical protein
MQTFRYDVLRHKKLVVRAGGTYVCTIWEDSGDVGKQHGTMPTPWRVRFILNFLSKQEAREHVICVGYFMYARPSTLLPKRLTYRAHPH